MPDLLSADFFSFAEYCRACAIRGRNLDVCYWSLGIPVRPRTRVTLTSLTGTFADSILTDACVGWRSEEVVDLSAIEVLRKADFEACCGGLKVHTQNWRCATFGTSLIGTIVVFKHVISSNNNNTNVI